VSYAFLEPGKPPELVAVMRYPGQEHLPTDLKIPSVVVYDDKGVFQTAGAEAEDVQDMVDREGWQKAEWWKLRLKPDRLRMLKVSGKPLELAPLPVGKTVDDVVSVSLGIHLLLSVLEMQLIMLVRPLTVGSSPIFSDISKLRAGPYHCPSHQWPCDVGRACQYNSLRPHASQRLGV